MDIVETETNPKQHAWLKWMGIQEPPLEADSWVPVARGLTDLGSDPSQPGMSAVGARLVELLGDAGIEARQRSYQFDESFTSLYGGGGGGMDTHIAVLVHERDHERALPIAVELNKQLDTVADQELTKEALEADSSPEA
jgi:hypothetical protein